MWGGILFIAAVLVIGGVYFAVSGKQQMGVLDMHAVTEGEQDQGAEKFCEEFTDHFYVLMTSSSGSQRI